MEKVNKSYKIFQDVTVGVIGLLLLVLLVTNPSLGTSIFSEDVINSMRGFSIIFMSIILEAIPFVMIGAFVASVIQIFVSEQTIAKLIPKNKLLGLLMASLMGLVFPVCECAIVPIMRRLLKKGVPLHIGVTFMLAVPIANPVVLLSTYYAFAGQVHMVLLRGLLGMAGAISVGFIIDKIYKGQPLKEAETDETHSHLFQMADQKKEASLKDKVLNVLSHTSAELYTVGRFLILGAFLSALMQTLVSRDLLMSLGQGSIVSTLIMMVLAFVLSLCSEADAFIARTFLGQFTQGSIVGFLIYGPMIDIKNTLMLAGYFKKDFVIKLITVISLVCFALAMLINVFVG